MSYNPLKLREIKKINKLFFGSLLPQCTNGKLIFQDDECVSDLNGSFKSMFIKFEGNVSIINNLPDGYGISFIRNKIYIWNILGKTIQTGKALFKVKNNFKILSATVRNWNGERINLEIDDKNSSDKINDNETNFEDSTLIIGQKNISLVPNFSAKRNVIDDTSIKGLYAKKPLPNGYTGYYHYYPDKNIYMSGKTPSNASTPILFGKFKSKNAKAIKRIANDVKIKLRKLGLDKIDTSKDSEIKPVKTDEKQLQEVAKYEQVLPQKNKQEKIIKTPSSAKKGKY